MVVGVVIMLGKIPQEKTTTDFRCGDFGVLFLLIIHCHIDANGVIGFRFFFFFFFVKKDMYIHIIFPFTFNFDQE